MLNDGECGFADSSSKEEGGELALKLRDNNCCEKPAVRCALPFKKRLMFTLQPEQPETEQPTPSVTACQIEEAANLSNRISEALEMVEKKASALYDITSSLRSEFGDEFEKQVVEANVQRVVEEVASVATSMIMQTKLWLDGERERFMQELRRVNEKFRASILYFWAMYANHGWKNSHLIISRELLPDYIAKVSAIAKEEKPRFRHLDELATLHNHLSLYVLKMCLENHAKPLVDFASCGETLPITELIDFGMPRLEEVCQDSVSVISSMDDSKSCVLPNTEEHSCDEDSRTKRKACLHCQILICPDCLKTHIESLKEEALELAEMAFSVGTLPESLSEWTPAAILALVDQRIEVDSAHAQRQFGVESAKVETSIFEYLQAVCAEMANRRRNNVADCVANFRAAIAEIVSQVDSYAVSARQFVLDTRNSLQNGDHGKNLSELLEIVTEKIANVNSFEHHFSECLQLCQLGTFESLDCNSLMIALGNFYCNKNLGRPELCPLVKIISSIPDSVVSSNGLEDPTIANEPALTFRLEETKKLEFYKHVLVKTTLIGPDCFGDNFKKPSGLTPITLWNNTPLLALVHGNDRISILSPCGSVELTLKINSESNSHSIHLTGGIVADEMCSRLIFTERRGVFSVDLGDELDGSKAKTVVPRKVFCFGARGIAQGLAVSSFRRELYTSFDDCIEAYSLNDGSPLFRWAADDRNIQIQCFQWATSGDMNLVYTARRGNELLRKNLDRPFRELLAPNGSSIGRVSSVSAVACDMFGNLIVCESGANRVQILSPQGKPISSFTPVEDSPSSSSSARKRSFKPRSVAVIGQSLFVSDCANDCVLVIGLPTPTSE